MVLQAERSHESNSKFNSSLSSQTKLYNLYRMFFSINIDVTEFRNASSDEFFKCQYKLYF